MQAVPDKKPIKKKKVVNAPPPHIHLQLGIYTRLNKKKIKGKKHFDIHYTYILFYGACLFRGKKR